MLQACKKSKLVALQNLASLADAHLARHAIFPPQRLGGKIGKWDFRQLLEMSPRAFDPALFTIVCAQRKKPSNWMRWTIRKMMIWRMVCKRISA